MDQKTGELNFWQSKIVVDETTVRFVEEEEEAPAAEGAASENKKEKEVIIEDEEEKLPRFNPERHITFDEAKKIKKDVELGEEMMFPLETHEDFGRIAAQTAKQVILSKVARIGTRFHFERIAWAKGRS